VAEVSKGVRCNAGHKCLVDKCNGVDALRTIVDASNDRGSSDASWVDWCEYGHVVMAQLRNAQLHWRLVGYFDDPEWRRA
jgi:hypothetical protein